MSMARDPEYGAVYTIASLDGRRHILACFDVARDPGQVEMLLEGRRIAAVLADPPYSSGGLYASQRRRKTSTKYQNNGLAKYLDWSGDARDQRSWTRWSSEWLSDLWRLSDPETYAFVFSDWRQVPALSDAIQLAGWLWRGTAVWDKGAGVRAANSNYLRSQTEYVLWSTAGQMEGRFASRPTVPGVFAQAPVRKNKFHLAQKPVEVLGWLLSIVQGREGVVVDPFAGSGSGLLAADAAGFESLSFEISPEIAGKGLERMAGLGFEIKRLKRTERPRSLRS